MARRGGGIIMAASAAVAEGKGKLRSASDLPLASSNLGKFLRIPEPPRDNTSDLISKFIKLNNPQGPRPKKNAYTVEKLKEMMSGKDRIGIPELVKLLSGQIMRKTPSA